MANTTNLNLVKPAGTDYALVSVINGNMDIIDSKVGAIPANESAQSQITALNNQIGGYTLVNKNMNAPSAMAVSTWYDDPFGLPNVSSGRNIYNVYNATAGTFLNIMKRSSDWKICPSASIAQGATLYISGIGG